MKKIEHVMIISGGSYDLTLIDRLIQERKIDTIIAVDGGLEVVDALKIMPNYIVGDFDTIDATILEKYKAMQYSLPEASLTIRSFRPEKDDTDTEIAIRLCIELNAKTCTLVGGTGTRLDHTMANVHLLKQLLDYKIEAALYDRNNKIYLTDHEFTIEKSNQFGTYFSMLPFTQVVKRITLTGFKYPLKEYDLSFGTSLCISNEIVEKTAQVQFEEGILMVFESMD